MYKKINSYFLIFIIMFSMFPVKADVPIKYNKELPSDIELKGTFFTENNANDFYVSFNNGIIQINSDNHYTDKVIKIKGTALINRLKKYNGFNVGITHISDNGIIRNEIKSLKIDKQGFAYLTCNFSTVIINGMTGTTTTTLTRLSGNQSISVPNGSSYDLNITNNQPSVWTINGTDYSKRVLWTLNTTSINLTDFQIKRITPYDSDMQIDMDDRILTYYENDTLISFWDEKVIDSTNTTSYIKVPKTSTTEQQQFWMYYGNSSMDSTSNGSDTFILFLDFENTLDGFNDGVSTTDQFKFGSYSLNLNSGTRYRTISNPDKPFVTMQWIRPATITSTEIYQMRNVPSTSMVYLGTSYGHSGYWVYYDGGWLSTGAAQLVQWNKIETVHYDTTYDIWINDVEVITDISYTTIGGVSGFSYTGTTTYIDGISHHKYNAIKPTWAADGEEQIASGTINITASVTGDSNEQSYNISQSREFTLIPTDVTNNVIINTISTDYNVTVTTYWTENTTLQSETATSGYAKQYINYTPSFNVTSADLNITFTFNFSAQDYIGTATSTLNDVSKTTTRDGQEVNASVGSLTEATPYWWNVTVPYNNIFTLSEQSDITVYLGISELFTDSTYNDPEGLSIDSRLWKFGDGGDSSSSNPTHIYLTVGDFNANYSVTETATVSPQTIVREFNVSVEVQPPQNVTTVPHQTNVSIDWDDYAYADKYSVYELEDGFPYVDTNPTVDGVKDAIYDYAHKFLIFSPNPVNPGDYETSYPVRTSLGAYFFHEAVDNDDKLGDDDLIYYFDLDNDGLTVDDPAWKITNNIVKKYLWNGGSWQVTGVSDAVGASTGGSTHYPKHELFIPIAELGANWTNGSMVKVLVKREDSSLTPDVVTWYPFGNVNDTDTSLWEEMALNEPDSYTWLANVTLSNYTATNLTPFTIYHGAISSWNDSTESDYTLFDVITEDIPVYNVSGYVFDDLGNIIAGAIIYSCNDFVHEITQTDIYGYWIGYNFREGNYTICGNKSGYIANSTDIYVSSNMTNINVTLTAYTITDWEIYQKLLLLESQNNEILLNMSVNNTIVNDKIDTILIFILLNMAVIAGIIIGKRGKDNDK